jgi:transposase InsO family protein
MTAKVLGIPKASLSNWVRSSEQGQLGGSGDRPVTPEQMELASEPELRDAGRERQRVLRAPASPAAAPAQPGSGRLSDEALLAHMRAIHAKVRQEYGWPRMTKALCARGHRVGKERVRRPMQQHGIRARGRRKFVVTTGGKHSLPIAPDLLQRDFTADGPNTKWTSDITYIATDEGWLYLAAFIDLHSRMIVGWSIQPHMRASLVTDALRMAWFRRRPPPGLIVHTDRGSQYCGNEFQKTLTGYGMRSSMSRKGDCWDNAPTESLLGAPEGWQDARAQVRHKETGHGRGDRLDGLLQPPPTAFHPGLRRPQAVRRTLGRGTAQQGRVTRAPRATGFRGKVSRNSGEAKCKATRAAAPGRVSPAR